MSDTDDTDVLILIPPDLFMVHSSDSEDSVDVSLLRSTFSNSHRNDVERVHVKDLIHHVNHLESRISMIESKENLETNYFDPIYNQISSGTSSYPLEHYNEEYEPKYFSMPERFNASLDNVQYQMPSTTHSTPIKHTQPPALQNSHHFSNSFHAVRSPYRAGSKTKESIASSYDSGAVLTDPLSISIESMEGPSAYDKPTGGNTKYTTNRQMVTHSAGDSRQPNQSQHKTDLIQEIDSFLDNVKKHPESLNHHTLVTERNRREKMYQCGDSVGSIPDLNFGLRDLDSLPVREEPVVSKYYAPLEPKPASSVSKRLSLPEVDKLLEEMESTQMLMEQKLRMKEAQFGKGQAKLANERVSFPERPSLCGEKMGSVPDLGFGIRQVMANSTSNDAQSSRKPVNEPKVIKRSMSLCGVNPTEQTSKSSKTDTNKLGDGNPMEATGSHHPSAHPDADDDADTNVPKVFVPRRLLLGEDSSTIPDLGFGLKNWYKSMESVENNGQATNSTSVVKENAPQTSNKYIQGGLPSSIPDLGFGLRNLWTTSNPCTESAANVTPHPISSTHSNIEPQSTAESSSLNHTSKPQTELQRNDQIQKRSNSGTAEAMCARKVEFPSQSGIRDSVTFNQEYGSSKALTPAGSSNLPSLSGLWNKQLVASDLDTENDLNLLKHKLGEERYRRQHCEQMIQQLQISLLEGQQKLAVAIQVDTGKDQAIQQFQAAWARLVGHWKELEEQRHYLAIQRQEDKEQYHHHMSDTLQKIKRYESEMSKALDLAQGYKEKSEDNERDKKNLAETLQYEIQSLHNKLQEREQRVVQAQQEHNQVLKEKEDMLMKMKVLEEDTTKDKTLLLTAKKELEKKSKAIHGFEADVAALKEEKGTLQLTLKEERSRTSMLEQHKKSLQTAIEEYKKKEKILREEVKDATSQMDKLKIELRDFYQEQVEMVVRDKLREFQGQLDLAEKSLRGELDNREQAINEIATRQIKQISDKHHLEVKLLEEKHKEELQLCQLKLAQATEQISRLETKLKSYNSRKGEIVEKLHGVMENQWQQALRIINGNSPLTSRLHTKLEANGTEHGHDSWSSSHTSNNTAARGYAEELNHAQTNLASHKVPPLQLPLQSGRSSNTDDFPFGKEGQVTYRVAQEKGNNNGQLSEHDLKKYIEMLLNRSPGNPVLDDKAATGQCQVSSHGKEGKTQNTKEILTSDVSQLPRWENVDRLSTQSQHKEPNSQPPLTASIPEFDLARWSHSSVSMEPKTGKPPWK